jgi:stage IV sporulation protein B
MAVRGRRLFGVGAIAALACAYLNPTWRALGYMPDRVAVAAGGSVRLAPALPNGVELRREPGPGRLFLLGHALGRAWQAVPRRRPAELTADGPGRSIVDVGAFGLPMRRVEVDAVETPRLVAGGQSIGIAVRTAGLLVVGAARGAGWRWPGGARSSLHAGDRIVAAGDRPIGDATALGVLVQDSGARSRALCMRVVRDGRPERICPRPRYDRATGSYHLGVTVRQGLSGIGTLTLYDPDSGLYAALGHRIQDGWEGQSVPVAGGRITSAPIVEVRRGFVGRPGEKIGRVLERAPWGTISGSGPYGIFGRLVAARPQGPRLPLATADEVHVGPAALWTVVHGQRVEHFRVRIERVDLGAPGGRGIVLRVVDRGLIGRTGGIVQGMSGSPIVQDGRLAGVLTHVLVSDSARGYGVFAAWMWREAVDTDARDANRAASAEENRPLPQMRFDLEA